MSDSVSNDAYECTVTVDCAVFGFQDDILKLLVIKRSMEPFKNKWLLPGGVVQADQSLEQAVDHVLFNLTGIDNIHHEQVKSYSTVDRHPVKRVITTCFYALVKPENHPVIAKKYVSDVEWVPIDNLPLLAIDHHQLALDAHEKLRSNLENRLLFKELLPEKFTLKEVQDLYESVLNQKLDRRNFRKRILQIEALENTGEIKKGHKGGPQLYKLN